MGWERASCVLIDRLGHRFPAVEVGGYNPDRDCGLATVQSVEEKGSRTPLPKLECLAAVDKPGQRRDAAKEPDSVLDHGQSQPHTPFEDAPELLLCLDLLDAFASPWSVVL